MMQKLKSVVCPDCGVTGQIEGEECRRCIGWGTLTVPINDPRPAYEPFKLGKACATMETDGLG